MIKKMIQVGNYRRNFIFNDNNLCDITLVGIHLISRSVNSTYKKVYNIVMYSTKMRGIMIMNDAFYTHKPVLEFKNFKVHLYTEYNENRTNRDIYKHMLFENKVNENDKCRSL